MYVDVFSCLLVVAVPKPSRALVLMEQRKRTRMDQNIWSLISLNKLYYHHYMNPIKDEYSYILYNN